MRYSEMTREELLNEKNSLEIKFKELKEKNLNLNMARGKPGKRQLDLVSGLLDILVEPSECEILEIMVSFRECLKLRSIFRRFSALRKTSVSLVETRVFS